MLKIKNRVDYHNYYIHQPALYFFITSRRLAIVTHKKREGETFLSSSMNIINKKNIRAKVYDHIIYFKKEKFD
jgi:hypothetical protein